MKCNSVLKTSEWMNGFEEWIMSYCNLHIHAATVTKKAIENRIDLINTYNVST